MPFSYNPLLGVGLDKSIPLDGAGKIPSTYLPSYVDDVEEYNNLAAFPATGETGKIYVAIDTGFAYRWSGSVYVQIGITAAAGATTQVQFNDAGAFGGDSGLTFNKTTDALSAGGFIPTSSTVPANGVYLPAANSVGVATNGAGRLFVDSAGLVGIGNSSPAAALDIGPGAYQSVRTYLSSVTDTYHLYRGTPDGVGFEHARVFSGRDTSVHTYGSYLAFYTEGKGSGTTDTSAERLRIDSSGRLLVGTSSGTHNLDMGQQLLPVSTTETKSIYRFGNASGLKRKFNLTTVAADRALFSIACGAAGVSNKVALEITVFLTGEKSGVSSDRVFTGKWSVVRGDAGTFTIANVYSAGSAGAATVTASGDNVNINAIFSVVSGGGCFVEIKGLLGTANQGSAENGFTVTMPAI